ncbi:MAG: divergent polysaccharide deacetylase family protein [Candidatus Omnitrophica bacterium]|nr:divergent polysaccharide deacetylase family protein [Candidatus Omnitrophota bacterium]
MNKERKYQIAIGILVSIIIINIVFLALSRPQKKKEIVLPPPAFKGRIAIVLDDWGYNTINLGAVKQIKEPLTASVLPNLKYSQTVARQLHESGFEIILHLPMQPKEKWGLEKNTISVSMNEAAVKKIVEHDLDDLVFADGVSNHMGSMATEDPKTMEAVFKVLRNRKVFFLDSFVTSRSVCPVLARKMGVPFAKRDVFLDNKNDPDYIRQQLNQLKYKARKYGFAIGIGHDRKVTLAVLKELMPRLEKEGYKFVFVSELAR